MVGAAAATVVDMDAIGNRAGTDSLSTTVVGHGTTILRGKVGPSIRGAGIVHLCGDGARLHWP